MAVFLSKAVEKRLKMAVLVFQQSGNEAAKSASFLFCQSGNEAVKNGSFLENSKRL